MMQVIVVDPHKNTSLSCCVKGLAKSGLISYHACMERIEPRVILENVRTALKEDVGSGDTSALLLPQDLVWNAAVMMNEPSVLCGQAWFNACFHELDPNIQIDWSFDDGDEVPGNSLICTLRGQARALLTAERTALNFLQTLSGTATTTHEYATQLKGSHARLLDTRKTLPGLRQAQKYAVRCGGGFNHRMGLYDAVMLKENHLMSLGSIAEGMLRAAAVSPNIPVIVEVENLDELQEALDCGAQHVLLDNFSLDQLNKAVILRNLAVEQKPGRVCHLEASGNIDQNNLHAIAGTGVDFISMGSLTKHVHAIDFSMRFSSEKD
ncbi:MAG: carboxylating nicotinate-nucleotide diphosphorylase [Gammaproteobacteria bacterium]|nr:MAG: carboxylating nicotinate-nucleotide diphosphorylase [Gammaproteobacteria bacterium]